MKRTKDIYMDLVNEAIDKGLHPITGWDTFGVERRWKARKKVNIKRQNLTEYEKLRRIRRMD